MMEEDGKIPSIRKLAVALNVDAMAIYHYFKNKDALLEAITVSLINGLYTPQPNGGWQDELRSLCHSYLQLLRQYPDLLETLLSTKLEGPVNLFTQYFVQIVAPLKLDDAETHNALSLLVDYLHGFALAMKCNQQQQQLTIDMSSGPIDFYCQALKSSLNSTDITLE